MRRRPPETSFRNTRSYAERVRRRSGNGIGAAWLRRSALQRSGAGLGRGLPAAPAAAASRSRAATGRSPSVVARTLLGESVGTPGGGGPMLARAAGAGVAAWGTTAGFFFGRRAVGRAGGSARTIRAAGSA